ncbi:MAG: hypothetical protein AAGE86_14185 [Pseudomonadota bacterium]
MSLRISNALLALALMAACSSESPEPDGDTIDCAIGPGAEYSDVCTLEAVAAIASDAGDAFLLHTPDGSFRRVAFDREQNEWSATDGADGIAVIEERTSGDSPGGHFILEIAGDRYIVPLVMLAGEE